MSPVQGCSPLCLFAAGLTCCTLAICICSADWQGKPVAVKVMEVQRSKDLRSARHELDINMMLQHANVVTCYDYQIRPQVGG